jgi:hypothetical protein
MIQTATTAHDYKYIHLKGTRKALLVTFINSMIFEYDVIDGIGRELLLAIGLAARIDMPLVISFRGVDDVSPELVDKLASVDQDATTTGIELQFANMSPRVEAIFGKYL